MVSIHKVVLYGVADSFVRSLARSLLLVLDRNGLHGWLQLINAPDSTRKTCDPHEKLSLFNLEYVVKLVRARYVNVRPTLSTSTRKG
jgi:hypothetical protein